MPIQRHKPAHSEVTGLRVLKTRLDDFIKRLSDFQWVKGLRRQLRFGGGLTDRCSERRRQQRKCAGDCD